MQAIRSEDINALKQAVGDIQEEAKRHHIEGHFLDTCYRVKRKSYNGYYYMTLLAFCGFHGQLKMADYLLEHGAGKSSTVLLLI